jgi:hypothetical protein
LLDISTARYAVLRTFTDLGFSLVIEGG